MLFHAILFLNLNAITPEMYYNIATGLIEKSIIKVLNVMTNGHHELSYCKMYDALIEFVRDIDVQNNVIAIYLVFPINGPKQYDDRNRWNRRHICVSSSIEFGPSKGAGTDLYSVVIADISVDSARP